MRLGRWTRWSAIAITAALVAACGGDDDDTTDSSDDPGSSAVAVDDGGTTDGGTDRGGTDGGGTDGDDASAGGSGSVVLGQPSLTADPSSAWAEAEGERFDYSASGSIHVECTVSDEQVSVNFQTAEGHDFLLQGSPVTGDWFLNLTFAQGGDNATYTADSMSGGGVYTIGDGALSYEGVVNRVVDFDIANAEPVDAAVAVDCGSAGGAGGDPAATIDGTSYTFPVSGAQSTTCEVSPTAIEVRVNRLASDGLQLEMSGTDQGGQWVGAVVVFTADGNYTSTMPPDGTGLTIDGATVSYEGTFQSPDGAEVTGSATATC